MVRYKLIIILILLLALFAFSSQAWATHTLDTSAQYPLLASSPINISYTTGSGATVLVVGLVVSGSTNRAGGALTCGPTGSETANTLTQADITRKYATSPETSVEVWYLTTPPIGAFTIRIPNTGTRTIRIFVASAKAQTGYGSAFDKAGGSTGNTLDPSLGVTTTINGDFIFNMIGHGYASLGTGDKTPFDSIWGIDHGAYVSMRMYELQSTLGLTTFHWTIAADDWAMVMVAFKELGPPNHQEFFTGTGYQKGACGSVPCWTEVTTGGSPDENYIAGDERLRINVSATASASYSALDHGTAVNGVYASYAFKVNAISGLTSGQVKPFLGGFDGSAAHTWSLDFYYTGSAYQLQYRYFSGGSLQTDTGNRVNLTLNKYYKFKTRYDDTTDTAEWYLYNSDGTLIASHTGIALTSPKLGIRYWLHGLWGANTVTADILYDNTEVLSSVYGTSVFSYGECNSTSAGSDTDDCASFAEKLCDSGSTYDWPIQTRWTIVDGENVCGTAANVGVYFPDYQGTSLSYNNYALERISNYEVPEERVKEVINAIQSFTPSRKVAIYNDDYGASYDSGDPVITDSTYDGVQILHLYPTGDAEADQQSETGTSTGEFGLNAANYKWMATRFQANASYTVSGISLMLKRDDNTTGYMRVHIYSDNSGVPGIDLGYSEWVAKSNLTATFDKYYYFRLLNAVSLVNTSFYWEVLEIDASSNFVYGDCASGAIQSVYRSTNGSSWDFLSSVVTGKYHIYSRAIDSDSGNFVFLFPPYFNGSRTEKYPIVVGVPGSGATPLWYLYSPFNMPSGDPYDSSLLKMVTKSTDDCPVGHDCGVIGMITSAGGQGSESTNEEALDAFDDAIQFLYTEFNADRNKVVVFGGSRGGIGTLQYTANPKQGDRDCSAGESCYNVIAAFAGAPGSALGIHNQVELSSYPDLQDYYPWWTSYLTYPNTTLADSTWKYSSPVPPHCKSISDCGDCTLVKPLVNTDVCADADACTAPSICSAIGYCTNATECETHFGGRCSTTTTTTCLTDGECPGVETCNLKYLVLASGNNDSIIAYDAVLAFDDKLRDAAVPHRTCIYMKGGHSGEYVSAFQEKLEDYVLNYLAKENALPTPLDNREYWITSRLTHAPEDAAYYGLESEDIALPFSVILPSMLDYSVDANEDCTADNVPWNPCCDGLGTGTCGSGHPYHGLQEPADIIVTGETGKPFEIRLLDDASPTRNCLQKWTGTMGNSSLTRKYGTGCGTDCSTCGSTAYPTCKSGLNGDEWCVIGDVQFGCSSPPCTYYWKTYFNGILVDATNTAFLNLTTASDAFTGTDESVGTNWTEDTEYLVRSSDAVTITTAATVLGIARYITPSTFANQYVKVSTPTKGTGGAYGGALLRSEASGGYRYGIVIDANTTNKLSFIRLSGNTYLDLIDSETITASEWTSMGVTTQGKSLYTIIKVWKNPANNSPYDIDSWDDVSDDPDYTLTDATVTPFKLYNKPADIGNYIGIIIYKVNGQTVPILDNFYGGYIGDNNSPKEAYTKVVDGQPEYTEIRDEFQEGQDYALNVGICQLPSCGDGFCQTQGGFEDASSCPEDCTVSIPKNIHHYKQQGGM